MLKYSEVCHSGYMKSAPGNIQQLTSHTSDCLAKNSYNESKCQSQVDALYECCNAFYAKNGDDAKSVSCPKAGLLRLKMKQKAQQGGA
jgi:hypothetical protein